MLRQRHPPPLDRRVDARRPISADLLAAAASSELELADDHRIAWFDAAEQLAGRGLVLVFDEFVIGRPDPLLLEAAHHLRLMRRAEHLGHFDDEEQEWYDEHADDDDAYDEPPTLPQRVLASMAHGQEAERLATDSVLLRMLARARPPDRDSWYSRVRLGMTLERLVLELAGAIRIGPAVVVDARLAGERADGLCWAA